MYNIQFALSWTLEHNKDDTTQMFIVLNAYNFRITYFSSNTTASREDENGCGAESSRSIRGI